MKKIWNKTPRRVSNGDNNRMDLYLAHYIEIDEIKVDGISRAEGRPMAKDWLAESREGVF